MGLRNQIKSAPTKGALYTPLNEKPPTHAEIEDAKKKEDIPFPRPHTVSDKKKVITSIRLDEDIMTWLRNGRFWQTRLNDFLRSVMEKENGKK